MTSAEQFANMLVATHGNSELRSLGLGEFSSRVSDMVVSAAGGARLLAFGDESFLIDTLRADSERDLTPFEGVEELSLHLLESTSKELQELRACLMADPGSDEFDDDPTGPGEDEDDDSPELA